MAFINCTDKLPEETNVVELWRNDIFPEGNMESRQFLRKLKNGQWNIDLNVNFVKFRIPLQEQQAKAILNGEWREVLGFDCVIVNEIK